MLAPVGVVGVLGVRVVPLGPEDAGEVLTLQRAAYVSEAQAYGDAHIPPLLETLESLRAGLSDGQVVSIGLRDGHRLGAVRCRLHDRVGAVGRLVVAPDRQREGLGGRLLDTVEAMVRDRVDRLAIFTGEHSAGNRRLYAAHGFSVVRRETGHGAPSMVHLDKVVR